MTDPYAPPSSQPATPPPATPEPPQPPTPSLATLNGAAAYVPPNPGPSPYDPGPSAVFSAVPYGAPFGAPPPSPGTDGFAISSLVTGLVGLAVVPVVLGIVALHRIGRSRQGGKGLAIAGIALGGVQIVTAAVIASVLGFAFLGGAFDPGQPGQLYGDNATLDRLWDNCDNGDMGACDDLYDQAQQGSDYESFGYTCGNRSDGEVPCSELNTGVSR